MFCETIKINSNNYNKSCNNARRLYVLKFNTSVNGSGMTYITFKVISITGFIFIKMD